MSFKHEVAEFTEGSGLKTIRPEVQARYVWGEVFHQFFWANPMELQTVQQIKTEEKREPQV